MSDDKYRCTSSESNKRQSFPKDRRLDPASYKLAQNQPLGQNFQQPFDKQDTFNKRTTALGQGTKSDFTKELRHMIDPGTQQIAGLSEMNKSHGKGFNFGTERNGMKNTLKNNLSTDPNIPGPASYRDAEVYKTESRFKYNTLGRCDPKEQRFKVKDNRIIANFPGPGTHNPTITEMDNSGGKGGSQRYLLSRNMSAKTTRINPVHKGTGVSRDKVPGPGNYDNKFSSTLNGDGKYMLSRHKNSGVRSFSKAARDTLGIRSKTPGPGAYDSCNKSDFHQGKWAK